MNVQIFYLQMDSFEMLFTDVQSCDVLCIVKVEHSLREKAVLMPGCSGAQCSVQRESGLDARAQTDRQNWINSYSLSSHTSNAT